MLDALLSSTKDVVTFFNIMTVLSCGSTTPNQVVISLQVKNRSRSITLHDKTSKAAQWANNMMKNVHKNINVLTGLTKSKVRKTSQKTHNR